MLNLIFLQWNEWKTLTCDVFHSVLVSPCLVSVFFWLYSITTVTPFNRWSPRLVISIWLQGPGPGATKMPFFAEIQINCNFFQLQPRRETSFSSLGDNGAFCAKCETRGGENSPPNIVGQTMLGVVICALLAVCFRCDLLYRLKFKSM